MPRRATVMYMPRDAKVNEAQPKTAEQIFAEKDAKIAELEKELAALKDKTRWRKYEDEPLSLADGNILLYYKSYEGEDIFVMGDARELGEQYAGVWGISLSSRQVYKLNIHWRPLDLPETEAAE